MSHKIERMLISVVNRLPRKHVSKRITCVTKQNFCWPNMLWRRNNLYLEESTKSYGLLYESQAFYVTNAEDPKKNITEKEVKHLVYYGLLSSRIKGLKVVSYTTSVMGLIAQPIIYDKVMALAAPAMVVLYTVMGFFTFVTPVMIHSVTRKYVTEIKYDPTKDVYNLKTMTFLLKDKIESFKLEDVVYNDSSGLFNVFTIKGKPYMIFQEGFLDRDHYIKLLGFDKPIDLKLSQDPDVPVESEISSIKSATQK